MMTAQRELRSWLTWGAGALVLLLLPPLGIALAVAESSWGVDVPALPLEPATEVLAVVWLAVVAALVLTYALWPVYTLVVLVVAGSLGIALSTRRRRPRVAAMAAQSAATIGWVTVLGYWAMGLLILLTVVLFGS